MSNKLSTELQEQIEREAKDKYPFCWTKNKHGEPIVQRVGQNPHGWSKHQRIINAYKNGAEVYAEKWQEEKQAATEAKKLLDEVFRKHEAGLLTDRFVYEKIKDFLYPTDK